ncbi:Uncharacterized protein TCM_040412 [Theobroma cacao]|uniref:Uncharacterized protein n=1 Tax=Theobroma cacao TaxID=3641 RepID=A0A061GRJ4_THECC|nr:Uncharacterized protein TCM_040412 [Theobroma cacao]
MELTGEKEEHAIPEKEIEPRIISKQEDVEDKNGSKRTRTTSCPANCEYLIPPDNEGFNGHKIPEGMGLEDTAAELKEKPRREGKGRTVINLEMPTGVLRYKEIGSHQICNEKELLGKQGRLPKRGEHTINWNNCFQTYAIGSCTCTVYEPYLHF